MYKRRRRRHIVMPVLAGLLTLATLGSTAFAAPSFSLPQAAAYFSSILCAPNAALAATRRVLDDAMDEDAVPTASSSLASSSTRHGRGRSAHGAAYR